MIDNSQQTDSTETSDQRAEWSKPEMARISAGSAELDFSGPDDGLGQTS